MSEHEGLLRRLERGDDAAWREFVNGSLRRVFGVAYRFTGRVEEAQDLTQEIFLKVFQRIRQFDGDEAQMSAWLLTVARHHSIDHLRRSHSDRTTELLDEIPSKSEGPEGQLQGAERAQHLYRGLRALPKELREVLVLRDLEGASYPEMADLLGLPLGTVKSRLSRGRLELAKRLSRVK